MSIQTEVHPIPANAVSDSIKILRGAYLQIPTLHLTPTQVQRFWSLDASSCDSVLGALVDGRFLERTPGGAFVRAGTTN